MAEVSVVTVEDPYEIQKITLAQHNLSPLSDCELTKNAATKAPDKMKVNESPGSDCIAPRVLKEPKHQISSCIKLTLAIIFSKSLNSGSSRHLETGKCYIYPKKMGIKHYRVTTDLLDFFRSW